MAQFGYNFKLLLLLLSLVCVGQVPSGGTAGQILTKNSSTKGDYSWALPSLSVTNGTANGFLKANGTVDSALVDYTNGRFTETSVSKWRAAMARQRAGGSLAKIAFYGSSTTYSLFQAAPLQDNNYPSRVRQMMKNSNLFGNVYEGEVWLTKYQAASGGATSIDSRFTIGAGWVTDVNGFGVGTYALGNNADASALDFATTTPCTGFTVTYITNPTFANFSYAIDGGATTNVDASLSTGSAVLTISGLSYATHTLTIKLVINGTKRVIISNIRQDDSYRPAGGVYVTSAGINGSVTGNWDENNGHGGTSLPLAFTRTAPDLTVIQLGVNDAVNAVSTSTFYTNYKAIVTYAKTAGSDVVIMIPHPPDPTYTNLSTWQNYVAKLYQIAKESDCSVIDMQQRWPAYSVGSISPYSYYASGDQIHASDKGYWDIATATYQFLLRATNGASSSTQAYNTIYTSSFTAGYIEKSATYTITTSDFLVNCTSGTFTVTLPTAVGTVKPNGRIYVVKNSGAGTITVATTSAQTIDGGATANISAGSSVNFMSTGSNWIIW